MPLRERLLLFGLITGVTVALDQITKALARTYLAPRPPISLWGNLVRLRYTENTGAFLGLGAGLPPRARMLIFAVFAGLLLVGVIVYLLTAPGLLRTEVVAGSLIVAGGLGNLIDRITRGGRVSDFLNLGIGPVRTGVFNLADLVLMIGAGLWLLVVIREMQASSGGSQ